MLNNAYVGRLGSVTDNPELLYDPQLEPNQERVGEFSVNGKELPLLMVRVPDGNNGHLAHQLEHAQPNRRPRQRRALA